MTSEEVLALEFQPRFKSFGVHIDKHFYDDDGSYVGSKRHSLEAFMPDQIERMKTELKDTNHPFVKFAETIWTPQVIADYEAKVAAAEAAAEAIEQPIQP